MLERFLANESPRATAGLNAPPLIPPIENAPAVTVRPIAAPKKLFPSVALLVATPRTTKQSTNVQIISARRA